MIRSARVPAMGATFSVLTPASRNAAKRSLTNSRVPIKLTSRTSSSGTTFAAFYPALVAGDYALHVLSPNGPRVVTIEGGAITEVAWSPSVV